MSSPNVSFASIPSSIRKPGKYFEFNTALAVRTLAANSQKVLLVGQRTTAGQVPAGVLTDVFTDVDAGKFFGFGSQLHMMASAAINTYPGMALQAIAMDDAAGGTAATGTITATGSATAAGTLTAYIANDVVTVAIAAADTPAIIAAALVAAITARPDIPVTAAAAVGVVTLTAKNKGTLGNQIKVSTVISGATGVTAPVVALASGATDPTSLAATLATVFTAGHTIIATSLNDVPNLQLLRAHLDSVSGALEQRGAIGVAGHVGTLAQSTTLAGAINSGRITVGLVPATLSMPFEVAAAYAALAASEEDPARPLNTLAFKGVGIIPLANRLSRTEQENALANGVTPFEVGPGDKVQVVRAVSTYTLDANGVPDISMLDITTIRTLDYVRKTMRERIALRFPRDKLSSRTPDRVRSELLDVMYKLEELEIVDNVELYKPGLIVERDTQDPNRLNAKIPTDVVNGLHVFGGRIDLIL